MRKLLLLALLLLPSFALAENTAVIEFTPPTTYTDGSAIPATVVLKYHVYQRKTSESDTFVEVGVVNSSPANIATGLTTGEYCWQVTVEADGEVSVPSNSACKTFAAPIPSTVVITIH